MQGKIESGQLCTVVPVKVDQVKTNDIVLCKVNGRQYLHLVRAINSNKFLICNNKGHDNGWAHANCVYGVVVRIED